MTNKSTSPVLSSIGSSEVLRVLLSPITRFERIGKRVLLWESGGGRAAGGGKFVGRVMTGRTWPSLPAAIMHNQWNYTLHECTKWLKEQLDLGLLFKESWLRPMQV